MGVHTDYLNTQEGLDCLSTCVIVHLDMNRCVTPIELFGGLEQIPELPSFLKDYVMDAMMRIPPLETVYSSQDPLKDKETEIFDVAFGPGPFGMKLGTSWAKFEDILTGNNSFCSYFLLP
jgi:hypothetical protein